jgi:lipoprotein NlpI
MEQFTAGRVQESLADFDRAIEVTPSYADIMWQRGISLYYLDRFKEAAAQFERDVR